MKTFKVYTFLAGAAILFAACADGSDHRSNSKVEHQSLPSYAGNSEANSHYTGPNLANANKSAQAQGTFWTEAAHSGIAEVELGKLASAKSQNPDVKKFGDMMVADHTRSNQELIALAQRKGVTLPATMDQMHQTVANNLQGLSGEQFDEVYVDTMVSDHERAVSLFQMQSQNDSDPEVKAFAAKTLPVLQKHLESAKGIQAKRK